MSNEKLGLARDHDAYNQPKKIDATQMTMTRRRARCKTEALDYAAHGLRFDKRIPNWIAGSPDAFRLALPSWLPL